MSNGMIVRKLQDKGIIPVNQFALDQWRFEQSRTSFKTRRAAEEAAALAAATSTEQLVSDVANEGGVPAVPIPAADALNAEA